jgi:hypothetical protein
VELSAEAKEKLEAGARIRATGKVEPMPLSSDAQTRPGIRVHAISQLTIPDR